MENNYYHWFANIISILTDLFFMFIPVASLFVFTSVFEGYLRYAIFGILLAVYLLVIYFAKDRIRDLFGNMLHRLEKQDEKTLLLIIAALMIGLRIIYTVFFDFDATVSGDTGLYSEIADEIIASGVLHSSAISLLFAFALHFVPF